MARYAIFLISLISLAYGVLISNSQIENCFREEEITCKKKLITAITVENAIDEGAEIMHFEIKNVLNSDGNEIELETPIQITYDKSQVVANYPLIYDRDFNWKPEETVLDSTYFDCEDDTDEPVTTCGWGKNKDNTDNIISTARAFVALAEPRNSQELMGERVVDLAENSLIICKDQKRLIDFGLMMSKQKDLRLTRLCLIMILTFISGREE